MALEQLSPSETLMAALENIENAEDVIIIWRNKTYCGTDDEFSWSANNMPLWRALGLIEAAKVEIIANAEDEDDDA